MNKDEPCWACESEVIFYVDVLNVSWCESCWDAACEMLWTQGQDEPK